MNARSQIPPNLLTLATQVYEREIGQGSQERDFLSFLQSQGVAGYLQAEGLIGGGDFRALALQTAGFSFRCATVLERLLRSLAEHGVPALTFKGVSWALLAYGDVLTRPFGDLDLLIPRSHWAQADVALKECGYQPRDFGGSSGREAAFLRFSKCQEVSSPPDAPQLDLHLGLYSQWIAFETPFAELWERHTTVQLDGIGPLPTFGIEDAIVFTCLHSYQDGWAYLKGLLDLALLLERHSPDWSALAAIAREREPMVARAVTFAVYLLGAPAPRGWQPCFSLDQTLTRYLEILARSEPAQLGLLVPSLWSGSRMLAFGRSLRAIFTPSDEDISSVDLSPSLVGFYPIVRALRLFKKILTRFKLK